MKCYSTINLIRIVMNNLVISLPSYQHENSLQRIKTILQDIC